MKLPQRDLSNSRRLGKIVRTLSVSTTVLALGLAFSLPAGATGTTIQDSKYGFSFSLPTGWTQVPLDGGDLSGLIAGATKSDPALKSVLSNEVTSAVKDGIKLFAVGPVEDNFFPNVSVYVTSSKGQLTGKAFLNSTDAQIKIAYAEAKLKNVESSIKTLPFGEVLEVSYQLSNALRIAHIDQIYVEHKSHVEIITLTTTSLTGDQRLLQQVAESWVWK